MTVKATTAAFLFLAGMTLGVLFGHFLEHEQHHITSATQLCDHP